MQICASNYSDSEIETGKNVLYCACGNGSRNIHRKGDDKKKKNVKDIITVLKEVDPDKQPIFVARDLSRLPSVTFDYVDVTRLLKDMSMMRTELNEFQTKVSSELTELHLSMTINKQDKDTRINSSPTTPTRNRSINAELRPLPPVVVPSPVHGGTLDVTDTVHTPTYRDIVHRTLSSQTKSARKRHRIHGTISPASAVTGKCGVVAQLMSKNIVIPTSNETLENNNSEQFTVVKYKKRKQKLINMRGTLENTAKIQVAESQCSIYISRASKTVTKSNIRAHIQDMGEECFNVELLKQNRETSFNSFKVKISSNKINTFLNSSFWPVGLVFRRYRERVIRTASNNTLYG
ncbi:uncharacterized protein LOC128202289 [Galleria mellonella]|uniref:Uncharacterized protein LOC128202289 n=1 Tax=Galleria mellonella TaxID=7137 RepID=A0ABM3N342_GALME|nr:uncharacterized protein LOC128202289 [Galleria mellonella]